MIGRSLALTAMIGLAGAYASRASGPEPIAARPALAQLPRATGGWTVVREPPLDRSVVQVLGVDDYTNRVYADAAGTPLSLYVGYYRSQRQGDTIHSPQNCLPGAGWEPIASRRFVIDAPGARAPVNEYVVQKGLDRQVVLYWYEGRGRIVANEYANKFWLMVDAAWRHRSSGSLVRVMVPAASGDAVPAAAADAHRFAAALLPQLEPFLP